jgi:hypothetical protein
MARRRRLRDEQPVPLNVPIPYPLRDRLQELQNELDDANLTAVPIREIIATLILFAEEDGAKLADLVTKYRDAPPDAASLGGASGGGKVVPFHKHSPGRPPLNRSFDV